MKSSIIIVVIGMISAGCSTTTYLSLTENDRGKVIRELNAYEKGTNVGAEVTIILFNGEEVEGELLSVRDSALILCTEYGATEEELLNSVYPIILVKNNEIKELTFEGKSYVWTGIALGYLTGAVLGGFIVNSTTDLYGNEKDFAIIVGAGIGSILGSVSGGIAGYALSNKEFILEEIPTGYNFYILKDYTRYNDEEPEYLKVIDVIER
ncbi:MAG: hypothetical protein IH618_09465 [Ignavibacteriaceae bacterium]|nr:hypothetical protein [Ignavibacteriaceae bacterium]